MVAKFWSILLIIVSGYMTGLVLAGPGPYAAGSKIVNRVISIDLKNVPLGVALKRIEEKAYFKFSYQSDIIDEQKVVSLQLINKPVSDALEALFDESIRFKEAGNHLILLQNKNGSAKLEKTKNVYYFTGRVTDLETGLPISGASVYDVEAHQACITDINGNYHISLDEGEPMRGFYISKIGYVDTTLIVHAEASLQNHVGLLSLSSDVNKMPGNDIEPIETDIEELPIPQKLVSADAYVHAQNLDAINETRIAQISFLPSIGIGSDLSTNGLMINHFSLNVLAGYSSGVHGLEIAGILNIIKNDVYGIQIGGISNFVGGRVDGVQVGGISNLVLHDFTGVQVGGIANFVRGRSEGIQVGGITNTITKGFEGIQVAGIGNFARRSSSGMQISGILNVVADTLSGAQISGIGNWAWRGVNYAQISGIINVAYENRGAQISGMYNYTRTNNGVQIGLVNSSHSGNGFAIGLFSYCQEGYRSTEISANEIFPLNMTFKTGTNKLYNIYTFGGLWIDRMRLGFGLGFGNKSKLNKTLSVSTELISYMVQLDNFDSFQGNSVYRISTSLDIRLSKWFSLYLGPDFNVGISRYSNPEGDFYRFINYNPLMSFTYPEFETQLWVGAVAGLRISMDR